MNFVIMTEQHFNEFSKNHMNKNIYQTIEYGRVMNKTGYQVNYVGVIDQNENILAATLLLTTKFNNDKLYAYVPGGFLIDYYNKTLMKFFITHLKKFLAKRKIIFLKTDPRVIINEYDTTGRKTNTPTTNSITELLKSYGFNHTGFTNEFITAKPRFNAVLRLNDDDLDNHLDGDCKYRINRAVEKGISIYKGNDDYIEDFYNLIKYKNKARNLNYYKNYYQIFSASNMIDIYFAKFDVEKNANNARILYEHEQEINDDLTKQIQESTDNNIDDLLNKKMDSDKKLVIYKNDIINSIDLLKKYPKGLLVCASAIIKFEDEIHLLIDGLIHQLKNTYPKFLLYDRIIREYQKQGFKYFNFNAVSGDFSPNGKYSDLDNFKSNFADQVIEFPGEFDLVINQFEYLKINKTK